MNLPQHLAAQHFDFESFNYILNSINNNNNSNAKNRSLAGPPEDVVEVKQIVTRDFAGGGDVVLEDLPDHGVVRGQSEPAEHFVNDRRFNELRIGNVLFQLGSCCCKARVPVDGLVQPIELDAGAHGRKRARWAARDFVGDGEHGKQGTKVEIHCRRENVTATLVVKRLFVY